MKEKPKGLYRVFALGVPNIRVLSEGLSEADARSRKREILMAYPAATVRIKEPHSFLCGMGEAWSPGDHTKHEDGNELR